MLRRVVSDFLWVAVGIKLKLMQKKIHDSQQTILNKKNYEYFSFASRSSMTW